MINTKTNIGFICLSSSKVIQIAMRSILLASVFILFSCSATKYSTAKAKKISEVRLIPPVTKEISKNISYEKFVRVLNRDSDVNKARMVEIFRRGQSKDAPPEYKLLDVDKRGVFYLLGLRNDDVIVAADGYVIPSGPIFWEYIKLMKKTKSASIEIRRAGKSILLNVDLI